MENAYNQLIQNVDTNGKKPASIQQYQAARQAIETQYNNAKSEAHQILENSNPSVNEVAQALQKLKLYNLKLMTRFIYFKIKRIIVHLSQLKINFSNQLMINH